MIELHQKGIHIFNLYGKELTQETFTRFFDYYYSRIVQFATLIVKSEVLAEEIVLDVFIKIWEMGSKINSINNIETYLFVSTRNTALNAIRKNSKLHFDMLDDSHVHLADIKNTADDLLIEEEMLKALNVAVNLLPSKCKIIFKLIREDGLNRNEVAQILNLSAKTVDNQVAIAVKKIAEHLNIDLNPASGKKTDQHRPIY